MYVVVTGQAGSDCLQYYPMHGPIYLIGIGWRLSDSVGKPLGPPVFQCPTYNLGALESVARDNHVT